MPIYDNIGGGYRQVAKPYNNIGGGWRENNKVFDNIGGGWRESYSSGVLATFKELIGTTPSESYTPSYSIDGSGLTFSVRLHKFTSCQEVWSRLAFNINLSEQAAFLYGNANSVSLQQSLPISVSGTAWAMKGSEFYLIILADGPSHNYAVHNPGMHMIPEGNPPFTSYYTDSELRSGGMLKENIYTTSLHINLDFYLKTNANTYNLETIYSLFIPNGAIILLPGLENLPINFS